MLLDPRITTRKPLPQDHVASERLGASDLTKQLLTAVSAFIHTQVVSGAQLAVKILKKSCLSVRQTVVNLSTLPSFPKC